MGPTTSWLDGCGHVPTWDDPEQVAAVLLSVSRTVWACAVAADSDREKPPSGDRLGAIE